MKKYLIISFFMFSGCSWLGFAPNGHLGERTYTIHLPKKYSKKEQPYPVLFLFHGNPSKGWQMKFYTGMNKTADKNNFIVIYPDAIDKRWDFSNCKNVKPDVLFIKNLIRKINNEYNVDLSRLYFCGMSGGGYFLSNLAKYIPEKMAAMILVASGKTNPKYTCGGEKTAQPIPFMLIQGTADPIIYNKTSPRIWLYSPEETISYWVFQNKCDTIPQITNIPDINKKDNSNVQKILYTSKIGKDVLFYKIKNGGHHWPNSRFDANRFVKIDLGKLNEDFDTGQAIWDFASKNSSLQK